MDNLGTANLTDCTVAGNSAVDNGGGVSNYGTANLTGCTVSGNQGGGLASYGPGPAGLANLIDTIVAGNTESSGAGDIGGSDVSGSDNLIGTGGSGGLVNGVDGNIVLTSLTGLGLAPLGNNGGATQTMGLLPGSPAIGAGVVADYPGTNTPITTDRAASRSIRPILTSAPTRPRILHLPRSPSRESATRASRTAPRA